MSDLLGIDFAELELRVMSTYSTAIETYDPSDTSADRFTITHNVDDPYAGLNRKQRRHAEAVENRAFRKGRMRALR